jgi:acetyltransferase-like isoleucine patch superfamily enzyme
MIFLIKKSFSIARSIVIQLSFKNKFQLNGFRIGRGSVLSNPKSIEIGKKVNIGKDAIINCSYSKSSTLFIGDNVYIGRQVQVNAYESVVIENNVLISDRVYISDATHNQVNYNEPIIDQGTSFAGKVLIKSGCWIGIGVCILPGVTIGQNSIVAANSVVTVDVPDYSMVAGVPAKVKKVKKNPREK